jgi:undecaprenyl diphosphate synthase
LSGLKKKRSKKKDSFGSGLPGVSRASNRSSNRYFRIAGKGAMTIRTEPNHSLESALPTNPLGLEGDESLGFNLGCIGKSFPFFSSLVPGFAGPIISTLVVCIILAAAISFGKDCYHFIFDTCGGSYIRVATKVHQRLASPRAASSSKKMDTNDPSDLKIPKHVAIIMDGNRRYGRQHYNDASRGHADGAQRLSECVEWCIELGVENLTVYAFSTENWKRSTEEVDFLMTLFKSHLEQILVESLKRDVRLRVLTSEDTKIPEDVKALIVRMEEGTKTHKSFALNLCVSYGSRGEIAGTCKKIAADVLAGKLSVEDIDEGLFDDRLLSGGLPDPDLLIRTSGEQRLSNFLLWQLAYTEMIFLNKAWPEMTKDDLLDCFCTFGRRGRRFGK